MRAVQSDTALADRSVGLQAVWVQQRPCLGSPAPVMTPGSSRELFLSCCVVTAAYKHGGAFGVMQSLSSHRPLNSLELHAC